MTATSSNPRRPSIGRLAGAVGVLVVLGSATVARPVRAQAPGDLTPSAKRDPISAEALFTRGKQLIEQGRTAEACEAFHESQRLDPAGGTLLRLALCREAEGKLASAWLAFTEVVRISQEAAGDAGKLAERVKIAHEHLASIEPRLPKLVVTVSAAARVDGLSVTANGLSRNEGSWGVALPVDTGDVTVEASAPGRLPFRAVVRAENGKEVTIEVPPLDAAPAAVASSAPASSPGEPVAPASPSSLRPAALIIGGVGVVAVGIGSYFGVSAISKWNDSNSHCPAAGCDAQGAQSAHDAKQAASISDVAVGVGAAAIVTGVVLYLVGAPKTVQARLDGVAVAF
jgi:hypothetical protein